VQRLNQQQQQHGGVDSFGGLEGGLPGAFGSAGSNSNSSSHTFSHSGGGGMGGSAGADAAVAALLARVEFRVALSTNVLMQNLVIVTSENEDTRSINSLKNAPQHVLSSPPCWF